MNKLSSVFTVKIKIVLSVISLLLAAVWPVWWGIEPYSCHGFLFGGGMVFLRISLLLLFITVPNLILTAVTKQNVSFPVTVISGCVFFTLSRLLFDISATGSDAAMYLSLIPILLHAASMLLAFDKKDRLGGLLPSLLYVIPAHLILNELNMLVLSQAGMFSA